VQRVVLIAPATWNAESVAQGYQKNYGKALAPLVAKAAAKKGDTLLDHADLLYCKDTKVSAASFVSYYQAEPRFDSPVLLPKIAKPVLVFAGTEDTVVTRRGAEVRPARRRQEGAVNDDYRCGSFLPRPVRHRRGGRGRCVYRREIAGLR